MATYQFFNSGPDADTLSQLKGTVNKYVVTYASAIGTGRSILNTYNSVRQAQAACKTVIGSSPLCILLVAGVLGYSYYKVLHNGIPVTH